MPLIILLYFLQAQHVSGTSAITGSTDTTPAAPNLQPTVNQERNDQRGNQHYSGELLMMSIVVPETC